MADLPETTVRTKPRAKDKSKTRRIPPYNVILQNDDHHSPEFVVDVLQKALGVSEEKAILYMHEAHTTGRAIVWTGTQEVAELKAEQIQTFHETQASRKLGPLGVYIEPAEG